MTEVPLARSDCARCAAGFHPFEVWPELVDVATVVCDCGEVFVPIRGSHRFCSRRCRSNHARGARR